MSTVPTRIAMAAPEVLEIEWSDGEVLHYPVRHLRENCPCASCREKRTAPPPEPTSLPILSQAETEPLRITKMEPTGRYAYAIHFSDGHDTGLYTLETLRELGKKG